MTHEPECPDAECKAANGRCAYCQCDRIRAAYHRGYEKGFGDGHEQGYRAGYNDHASARAYAEQVYGPYTLRVSADPYWVDPVFPQHGKGENP